MLEVITLNPLKFVLRSISGFTGGLFGTLMLLIIFTLSSGVLNSVFAVEEVGSQTINPIFLAVFLIMIFTGLLMANLFSSMLISFCDRDKYFMRGAILHQVFIFNAVMFFMSLPFYIFSLTLDFGALSIVALLHSIVALSGSHLVLENVANPRYSLVSIYGTSLGLILGAFSNLIVFKITGTVNVLLFAFLPVTWFFMALAQCGTEALYVSFYKLYGIDFLSNDTEFGEDTTYKNRKTEDEEIEEEIEKDIKKKAEPKDEDGAEFLEKNN